MNLPQDVLHRVVSFLLNARIVKTHDLPSPCTTGKHDFMDGVDESLLAPVRRDTDDASLIYHLNHPREDDVTVWDLYEHVEEHIWCGWHIHSLKGRTHTKFKKEGG